MNQQTIESGSAHQQVNHDEIEASQVLGDNGSASDNGTPRRAGPLADCLAVGPPNVLLATSDPLRHLQPGMFTANVAHGLNRAGCALCVRTFCCVLESHAGPGDMLCVLPQSGSANADILKVLAHRPQRSVSWVPGRHQDELLDDHLAATPPRVCVLPLKRVEQMANCRGEGAVDRLSRWMPHIPLVLYDADRVVIVQVNGARIALPGYDVPVMDPEGSAEAFVAGFIASLAWGQSLIDSARVGLAQMACVAATEGPLSGFMTLKQAAEFICTHAERHNVGFPCIRLMRRFGL